jgi:hypothetical protein
MPVPTLTATDWLYVVVQNPETDSQIVGHHDEALDVHFIPAFKSKEEAQQGLLQLPKSRGGKYEVQAIIFEDLHRYASDKVYMLFVLDADGRVVEQIAPLV